jgi:hypothetical protein
MHWQLTVIKYVMKLAGLCVCMGIFQQTQLLKLEVILVMPTIPKKPNVSMALDPKICPALISNVLNTFLGINCNMIFPGIVRYGHLLNDIHLTQISQRVYICFPSRSYKIGELNIHNDFGI